MVAPTAPPLPATMPVTTRPARAERPVLVVVEAGASSPALLRLTSVSWTSSKPVSRYGGLLPGLAAGRIAEAAAASTTEGRSDGGLARKKARLYSRGVLTYPQGKPLKPS